MTRRLPLWLLLSLLIGCPTTGGDDDDSTEADDDDSGDDDDAGDDDDSTAGFPASPLPFSFDLAGGLAETITIDTFGSCQNFSGSSDFRQQWGGANSWALRVQITGSYPGAGAGGGPGTYTEADGVLVTLLRNVANGEFFQAGANTAHTATLVIEGDDGTNAWGAVTVDGMTDTAAAGGTVTVTPDAIPVWCSSIQH